METTISKRKKVGTFTSQKKVATLDHPLRQTTLEEVLEKSPFIRKKHEDAIATLKRCPFPEELLLKRYRK
ncbi:hypothetical protein [Chitinophaga sp. CF418]|uniref:hypothetical protein n=1 Tax=Chitinophaga sp. CF418 TaxID=1855287 RepID=UPI000922D5FA|nr:hypothetical protein [Chitinophaga sp. CF418]SHN39981.1 hypothetical protein SAMN05216311_111283 [Chitinophaga sp. CF418]